MSGAEMPAQHLVAKTAFETHHRVAPYRSLDRHGRDKRLFRRRGAPRLPVEPEELMQHAGAFKREGNWGKVGQLNNLEDSFEYNPS